MPYKTRAFVNHLTAALSDQRIQRILSAKAT